jgi:hypothetical protein
LPGLVNFLAKRDGASRSSGESLDPSPKGAVVGGRLAVDGPSHGERLDP